MTNIHKCYGPKVLFDNVSWHLGQGEKVALVGDNGMGKSTLFKIILGLERQDSGKVVLRKGARAAMIAQDLEDNEEMVLERVVSGDEYFMATRERMESLEKDQAFHQRDPEKWSREYGHAQHEFESFDGYEREAKAKTILAGLGFREDHWSKPLNTFSGGWRMRVELARLLLLNPDILLLDEPSNHLDLESVVWLESFLKKYDGSILLISHDRSFINGLANKIAHLDCGKLTVYTGNYDAFEKLKKERELHLEKTAANQQKRIDEIERFIERFRAKNTKATQAQSRIKQLAKLDRVETATEVKSINFRFPQPKRFGRSAMELIKVRKQYGVNLIYPELSLTLERGVKTALVGANGAGKSTLMKILAGATLVDAGEVRLGANVSRAYYAQHQSEVLNDNLNVLETLTEIAGSIGLTQQRNILGAFRFSGDEVQKKVAVLSGGERARLVMAKILVAPSSILLLDEPTNHLDMRSRTVLAAALSDFDGCLVVISHDRYFLDGFINRVWEVDGGKVREYIGTYSDYKWKQEKKEAEQVSIRYNASKVSESKDRNKKHLEAEDRNRRYRETKPLKKKLEVLEKKLESVMIEKENLDKKLATEKIYHDDNKNDLLESLDRHKELIKEENILLHEIENLTDQLERVG